MEDSEINIEGYTLLRKDRCSETKTRGGGVALYIRDNINVVQHEISCGGEFSEYLFCTIVCNNVKTFVGVCYRPPDSLNSNDENLFEIISEVSKQNCVIMGDFNFAELKWDRVETISERHQFIKCINDNFFHQLVEKPTRGENFLDLVMCNDETLVEDIEVGEQFGSSDHQVVRFKLVWNETTETKNDEQFNYFKADYKAITNFVKTRNWGGLLSTTDIDENWAAQKAEIILIRDKFVPHKKKSRNKRKWVNKTVVKCRRAKIKA